MLFYQEVTWPQNPLYPEMDFIILEILNIFSYGYLAKID